MLTARFIVLVTSISIASAGTPLSPQRQAPPTTATADAATKLLEAAAKDIPRDTFDPLSIINTVGKDRSALLAWVRDQTYWVPYRGALRGPTGVLMDRLGNSLDQSLLLAELLTLAGHTVRLAQGNLSDAGLARMLEASRPSVLHFATHGFVFDDPKKQPFPALNRRGTAASEDGRLTLDEVYGLRLDTDLVVLSACRSGSGQVGSDSVVGLTRGFFYAGSPSVLATFWDVVDEATANLMSGFYRQYVRTHAKGASLRAAQLALLSDLRAGKVTVVVNGQTITLPEHPLLWAAFFLSGEP